MKKSRLLAAVLCLAALLTACKSTAISETSNAQSLPAQSSSAAPVSSSSSSSSSQSDPIVVPTPAPDYTAYEVYCVEDGRIIVGENIFRKIAPASLTKLLTASVALKYWDADEVVTVGTELELVQPESSLCLISKGNRLTMYDLLTGLLLPSGNDAAYTVAVTTARKVSGKNNLSDRMAVRYFCSLMNDFAAELGMVNSNFANPEGWDNSRHYTTVSDLTKVAKYALSVPEIREIVSTRRKYVVFESGESITWNNGNRLLYPDSKYYCENAIGMKTGFTDNAGLCLIAAFEKDGKTYIITVVGCTDSDKRYEKILELYDDIK